MDLQLRKPDGWTTGALDDVEEVTVVSGKTNGHLSLTFIGVRSGAPNEIVQDVFGVNPDERESWRTRIPGLATGRVPRSTSSGQDEKGRGIISRWRW